MEEDDYIINCRLFYTFLENLIILCYASAHNLSRQNKRSKQVIYEKYLSKLIHTIMSAPPQIRCFEFPGAAECTVWLKEGK